MALTIDQIRRYWIPLNISRPNNANDFRNELAVYNDSVNLYKAIITILDEEYSSAGATNLSNTPDVSTVDIVSSSGTDTTLPAATTSLAGVMSATDKTRLNNLITLSGVAAAATNLGSFTGSIIQDNRTVKQALQDLETSLESGTALPLGDLTSTTSAITVTSGTDAVFVPTGVSLTLVPGNINLSALGGSLPLTKISTSGASANDVISFNGTNWVVSGTPAIPHNSLSGLQGGQSSQYYHLNSSLYNVLASSPTTRLIGRYSAGTGAVQALTAAKTVTINSSSVELVNDEASPGNSYYYGTDNTGTKGYFELPASGASFTVSDTTDIDLTYSSEILSAELSETGVIADTYGSASETIELIIDEKGRITSATAIPISITSSSVSNFLEASQDVVGNYITAGTGVTVSYSDVTGFTTISATTSTTEQIQDIVGDLLDDSAEIDFTYDDATPSLTALLTTTGVTPATYGPLSGASYPRITVDSKGRITSATNQPILITSSQVFSFGPSVIEVIEGSGLVIAEPWTFNEVISAPTLPTLPEHLANKEYVDSLLAGVRTTSVRVATTTSGTLASDFEDGDTIDGTTLATGDRILIKDQVASETNGIYTVNASGAPTRATDMDAAGEVQSTLVIIEEGSTNASTLWLTVSEVTVLNTDPITFTQVNLPWNVVAGDGLTLTGVTLDIVTGDATNIVVNANDINLATTAVTPDSYGAADTVPTFTVDAYGRLTAAADVLIDIPASQVSDFTTEVEAIIDAYTIDPTMIDPGTANQIFGTDASATSTEWKTLSGTTNQVTVTHGVGTITLAAPQNLHTLASPYFANLNLQGTPAVLSFTGGSAPLIDMSGSVNSSITMGATTGASAILQMRGSTSTGSHSLYGVTTISDYIDLYGSKSTIGIVDTRSTLASISGGGNLLLIHNDGGVEASGDRLGSIIFKGNPVGSGEAARISAYAGGTFSGSSHPAYIDFFTTPSATTTPVLRMRINSTGETEFRAGSGIRLYDSDNTQYIAIVPPSTGLLTSNYTLTLPANDGSADQVLSTDGSGTLSWTDVTTGDTLYTGDGTISEGRSVELAAGVGSLTIYGSDSIIEQGQDYIQLIALNATIEVSNTSDEIYVNGPQGVLIESASGPITLTSSDLTFVLGSDATGDIYFRNGSGVIERLPIGTDTQVLTVSSGVPTWDDASSGGSPAGTNYNLQYYNSGAFGADSNITVTPGAQPKLAVGTSTPLAPLHGRSWNTSGSPVLITQDSSVNSIMRVLSSGYVVFGNNESNLPRLYQTGDYNDTPTYTVGGLSLEGFFASGTSYDLLSLRHTELTDGSDGPFNVLRLSNAYTVSSGSGIYTQMSITPTIGQSGSYAGDCMGIYISPLLAGVTASGGWFDIVSTTNNANSWFLYSSGGSTKSYIAGNVGIGETAPTQKLDVGGTVKTQRILGKTSTPTVSLGSASVVGTGASYTIVGTDLGFRVALTTGTGISASGTLFSVVFSTAYDNSPFVVFSPSNAAPNYPSSLINTYAISTTGNVSLLAQSNAAVSTTYQWDFIVIGR